MSELTCGEIFIEELGLLVRIGATAEERAHPQKIALSLGLTVAGVERWRSVSLDETVDYSSVVSFVQHYTGLREWVLVEHLGAEIGEALLTTFPLISTVHVQVRKFVFTEARSAGISCVVARSLS